MKRLLLILSLLFCTVAFGATETINWYVGDNLYTTTTCESGGDITLPTAPTKYGYTFQGWRLNYIPIEYLESTGTQYIDTGFVPNINSGMEIDVYSVRSDKPTFAMASSGNQDYLQFGASAASSVSDRNILVYNGHSENQEKYWYAQNIYGAGTGRYTITIDGQNFSIKASNGSVYKKSVSNSPYVITANIYLFGRNYGGTPEPSKTRIYFCKLYDNNTLVRDFIPVLDSAGIPCMYDRVEDKFYYNSGTGNFIAGPVINE